MILTSDLGIVRKHRREHTALEVLGGQVRSARAEAAVVVQREAGAVIQDSELVHVDVHASIVSARQLRPRAEANDRDAHEVNDNASPGTPGGLLYQRGNRRSRKVASDGKRPCPGASEVMVNGLTSTCPAFALAAKQRRTECALVAGG